MIPIGHENRIYRPIEVRRRWPVDSQRSQHAITVLQRVMTVVPRCSILYGLEFVREGIVSRDRALRNRIDTVMFEAVQHSDTMPMDCCAVVEKAIFHGDLFIKFNQQRNTGTSMQSPYQHHHPSMPLKGKSQRMIT